MSDDDKKKVNIDDLPVPLKELDKEEREKVIGGVGYSHDQSDTGSRL